MKGTKLQGFGGGRIPDDDLVGALPHSVAENPSYTKSL